MLLSRLIEEFPDSPALRPIKEVMGQLSGKRDCANPSALFECAGLLRRSEQKESLA
jgi:hypothetical protein